MFVTAIIAAETKFGFRAMLDDVKDILKIKGYAYTMWANVAATFVIGSFASQST
jgi:hypothetical protein